MFPGSNAHRHVFSGGVDIQPGSVEGARRQFQQHPVLTIVLSAERPRPHPARVIGIVGIDKTICDRHEPAAVRSEGDVEDPAVMWEDPRILVRHRPELGAVIGRGDEPVSIWMEGERIGVCIALFGSQNEGCAALRRRQVPGGGHREAVIASSKGGQPAAGLVVEEIRGAINRSIRRERPDRSRRVSLGLPLSDLPGFIEGGDTITARMKGQIPDLAIVAAENPGRAVPIFDGSDEHRLTPAESELRSLGVDVKTADVVEGTDGPPIPFAHGPPVEVEPSLDKCKLEVPFPALAEKLPFATGLAPRHLPARKSPQPQIAAAFGQQQIVRRECEVHPPARGLVFQDHRFGIVLRPHERVIFGGRQALTVGTEHHLGRPPTRFPWSGKNPHGRRLLERAERQPASFLGVGELEARGRPGQGRRGIAFQHDLTESEEFGGLGAVGFANAFLPQRTDHRQHDQQGREGACSSDAPTAAAAGCERGHGRGEGLLGCGKTSGVPLPPDRELAVRSARPQHVVGAAVFVPRPRCLAQFVAEPRAVGFLGPPTDEAGPGREKRLVDHLDACRRCLVAFTDLVCRTRS